MNIKNKLSYFMIPSKSGELIQKNLNSKNKLFYKIIEKIKKSQKNYNLKINKHSIIITPNKIGDNVLVISSHFDNVYKECFVYKSGSKLIGTFDNAVGIYSSFELMSKKFKNVIYAFTDCEETNCFGIKEVYEKTSKIYKKIKYIILDVTEENVLSSTTIENINIKLNLDKKDLTIIPNEKCGYDEAKYLNNLNAPSLSVCLKVNFFSEEDDCHSEKGNYIYISDLKKYLINLKKIIKEVGADNEKC